MEEMSEGTGASGAKMANTSLAPPVASLGVDLLGQILLRLPDMASLASAARVCKLWHGVASDPTVFLRFDALRRPPLVGFILTDRGDMLFPRRSPHMLFVWSTSNPNLAAAAKDGDFLFEHLPAVDSDAEENGYDWDEWRLRGCDGGLQLLSRGRAGMDLAVYDPIARTAVFLRVPDVFRGSTHKVRYAILVDESDGSFLVIGIEYCGAIFSSRAGKWITLESRELAKFYPCYNDGMTAGRFVYWQSNTKKRRYHDLVERILVLDTTTMEWSVINVPFRAGDGESYCVANMPEHGGLCLVSVSSKEQCLQLWFRNSILGEWVLMKSISLLNDWMKKMRRYERMKRLRILALAVRASYVYMEFWSITKPKSYFLVFNLRTKKMTMVRNDAKDPYRSPAFPVFMRLEPLLWTRMFILMVFDAT